MKLIRQSGSRQYRPVRRHSEQTDKVRAKPRAKIRVETRAEANKRGSIGAEVQDESRAIRVRVSNQGEGQRWLQRVRVRDGCRG